MDGAEKPRALIALDLKFIIGCDCEWKFDDEEPAAAQPEQLRVRNTFP